MIFRENFASVFFFQIFVGQLLMNVVESERLWRLVTEAFGHGIREKDVVRGEVDFCVTPLGGTVKTPVEQTKICFVTGSIFVEHQQTLPRDDRHGRVFIALIVNKNLVEFASGGIDFIGVNHQVKKSIREGAFFEGDARLGRADLCKEKLKLPVGPRCDVK